MRWPVFDSTFASNKIDTRFKVWNKQGLTAYCIFLHNRSVKDFETLKNENSLSDHDFHRFLTKIITKLYKNLQDIKLKNKYYVKKGVMVVQLVV